MKAIIIYMLVGIFILFTGLQAFGEELTGEQKKIWSYVEGYWKAVLESDVATTLANFHDKAMHWSSKDPIPLCFEEVWSVHSKWLEFARPTSYELKPLSINIVNGNVANVFYYFKYEREGTKWNNKGKGFETWIKQNGKWVIVGSASYSCNDPAPCPYGF